ncbi:unnamed protein product [Amaranthus hypochondriacus]
MSSTHHLHLKCLQGTSHSLLQLQRTSQETPFASESSNISSSRNPSCPVGFEILEATQFVSYSHTFSFDLRAVNLKIVYRSEPDGNDGKAEVIRVYHEDTFELSCTLIVVSVLGYSKCVVDLITLIVLGFMVRCMNMLDFGLDVEFKISCLVMF